MKSLLLGTGLLIIIIYALIALRCTHTSELVYTYSALLIVDLFHVD